MQNWYAGSRYAAPMKGSLDPQTGHDSQVEDHCFRHCSLPYFHFSVEKANIYMPYLELSIILFESIIILLRKYMKADISNFHFPKIFTCPLF